MTVEPWRALHRLADSFIPRFADTFQAETEKVRGQVTVEMVAADLTLGDPTNLYALIDGMTLAKAERGEHDLYAEILTDAASLELTGEFRVQSVWVQQAARTLTANMVTRVNGETKRALRQVIFEAIRDGKAPAVTQKVIRGMVGLTARDTVALARFAELQQAGATTARLRALADKRVDKYSAKLLRRRAVNIARTETLTASVRGQQLAWREMASNGLIDTSRFQQRWVTTPDDRLCDECAPMDGELVSLGGSFESSVKGVLPSERVQYAGPTVEGPPLHPS